MTSVFLFGIKTHTLTLVPPCVVLSSRDRNRVTFMYFYGGISLPLQIYARIKNVKISRLCTFMAIADPEGRLKGGGGGGGWGERVQ